ncbi:hypothetical protein ACQEU8_17325 [Streptomyces sp. CA-250714]|uniref:hypothetical protein n=1 Tax=Streptomyces sp. CA-250714 TaxID=3240060 RepID=UPI003D8CFA57
MPFTIRPDRAGVVEHLAHLEADKLEYAGGVLITRYNDTRQVLNDAGRPCNPAAVVREVDAVDRFAPAEHEFAVTPAARRLARGEVKMQEVMGTIEVRDRIHTMALYSLALQLAVFSRKGVQRSLDQGARSWTSRSAGRRGCPASTDASHCSQRDGVLRPVPPPRAGEGSQKA